MRQGKFIEQGETEQVFNNPQHPYTKDLLNAALFSTVRTTCYSNSW